MWQYKQLLNDVLFNEDKETVNTRSGETIKIFGHQMRYDLREGFPLLTTKSVHFKSVFYELIWFLSGRSDLRYLINNGVRIWNADAYRVYRDFASKLEEPDYRYHIDDPENDCTRIATPEEFEEAIINDDKFNAEFGDLGPIYGVQWRNFAGVKDQLFDVIETIKKDKRNRRLIVSSWNPTEIESMVLPPCHVLFQFNCAQIPGTDKYYLDCQMYQRSLDIFLGGPFNIASYALLIEIVAKLTDTTPRYFIHTVGDAHIYTEHLPQVNEQLERECRQLPTLNIKKQLNTLDDVKLLTFEDVELIGYNPHPKLTAKVLVG